MPDSRLGKRQMNKHNMEDTINELYNELDAARNTKNDAELERILDYFFQNGTLILKVQYYSKALAETDMAEVLYQIVKTTSQWHWQNKSRNMLWRSPGGMAFTTLGCQMY
eukprot:6120564-Ditylum_brightwellii.AAC.1